MARAIFISYRRDDTEGEAGRLFDDLVRTFGENSVFMDVAGINPGIDFRKVIDDNVASCGVLLAIIGPAWATVTNSSGQRRLDDPADFVRLEVASALARNVPVVPVLVHEAKMPRPDQLPDNLKDLAYRNSVELSHTRWNSDVQLLTAGLRQYVSEPSTAHSVSVTAHAPAGQADAPPLRGTRSGAPRIAAIAAVVLVVIAAGVFMAVRHSHSNTAPQPGTAAAATLPASPQSAPAAPLAAPATDTSPLVGTWTNPTPKQNNGLAKLEITANGQQLTIHAWGHCEPVDCDWGEQTSTFDGHKANANWTFLREKKGEEKGRIASVTLQPASDGLQVTVMNIHPKRPATQEEIKFVRAQ